MAIIIELTEQLGESNHRKFPRHILIWNQKGYEQQKVSGSEIKYQNHFNFFSWGRSNDWNLAKSIS